MVDNNIYDINFVDSIRENQKIGDTPNYCIPLMFNAITVQGISYSDPYLSSFKLKYKMADGAPEYINKSDYAFKTSLCMMRDERPAVSSADTLMDAMEGHHDNNVFANGDLTYDSMMELVRNEEGTLKLISEFEPVDAWGMPRRMRLCGGGETALNSASGWGSPPAANNNAGNWGGNGQSNNTTNSSQPQWGNANQRPPTQPDLNSNKGNGNQMPPTTSVSSGPNWQSSQQMPSAQPNNNGSAPPSNGSSTNSNNGGNNSPNSTANGNGPPGGNGNNGNSANNTSSAKIEQLNSMREALFSQEGWGGQHVNQDTNWDVPGSPEPGVKVEPTTPGGPPAWKPSINNGAFIGTDLWEANLRNGGQPPPQPVSKTPWGHTPTTNIGGTWGEDDDAADSANVWNGAPQQQHWPAGPPQQPQQWAVPKKDDWNTWGEPHRGADPRLDAHRQDPRAPPADMRHELRGEMRGISGRLNGDMWNQHNPHTAGPNKMMPANLNHWGVQGPKDSMKGTGWEEPSPPATRRAAGGFDDGTSLWAQRSGPMGGRGPQGPPPQRAPPAQGKPDTVWGAHPQRNGGWEEPHTPVWPDRDVGGWPDSAGPGLWPATKPKQSGPGGAWTEEIGEWGGSKQPPLGKQQLSKEMIWSSKQFRCLVEHGYKKEEVEAALRTRDMNAEEALELLAAARADGGWRGRDDHFHHGGFPPAAPHQPLAHKLPHTPHHYAPPASQPSASQLRMLVQQIQMAVTAGYLNHQILNQPLAPQTLVLLNQLLQQIKVMQQLVHQHSLAVGKANSNMQMQLSMQIAKAKQQISALQSQISHQQSIYIKQQSGGGGEMFNKNHDPLAQMQSNFSDMSITKDSQSAYGGSGNQQSRLNQWKLPSLDKDGESPEFSRAPGTTAKTATSPQLGQLGLQPDTTWGLGGRNSGVGEGWGDSSSDVADGKDSWPSHSVHQPMYDLVPEFEPGKPWKGNQMKNVEDDPAMTPGSVVRSPLSLTVIKDTDMLAGKTSPPPGSERSLSSSTWTYPPPASTAGPLKPPADAWGASKSRAAPPQSANKGWPQHHNSQQRPVPAWQASTWLLLKNLTAQIDGSTLKTLCVQHGPLLNFHLYLNQGVALARYSTREEAAKAQMALNNCVLSNTTIFAESPAESDVQMMLQHLGLSGNSSWRAGSKDASWNFPSLWSQEPHEQRSTPSINNFLPPDLLGGESL